MTKLAMSALFAMITLSAPAWADEPKELVFTVGGDKDAGKSAAKNGKWVKSLTKALKAAGAALAEGGPMTVVVKVAAGDYDGDLGSGAFQFPELGNKDAELRLEGGYSDDFSRRDPFGTPTRIITVRERSAPLIQFHPSRPNPPTAQMELKSLYFDGFLCDVGNSNNYDAKSNTLLKGRGTSTHVVIRFGNTKVGYFEMRNCVFINSPHRAFETLLRPAHEEVKFRFYNNVFVNCVIPVKLDSALTRGGTVKEIEVDHCSFLLNWAFNPDVSTSNPCALEIGNKNEVEKVTLTNNLFYANFGGAILALSKSTPPMVINNNNFVGNGLLHELAAPGAVAMVVEAGGKKQPIDVETIEEIDFVEEAEGNVSIPPGINLSLGSPTAVDSSTIEPKESWENGLNRLLGKNLEGGKVEVNNYAPKQNYDPKNPPFPRNPEAAKYGASPSLVK